MKDKDNERKNSLHSPLTKTRKRVFDHGEVFTPEWMVKEMINLVENEVSRIESRWLEPACGSGNFLVPILTKKLEEVKRVHGNDSFHIKHYALLAVMSVYGIELLKDNVMECRDNLLNALCESLNIEDTETLAKAAKLVLSVNIVQADALTFLCSDGSEIIFPEWSYVGSGSFQRRDFAYGTLAQLSSWENDSLFSAIEKSDIFTPIKTYPLANITELSELL